MINRVKAFGNTKNNPILAIIIPKKIGLREKEKKPSVTNAVLFSSSIPIRQDSLIFPCANHTNSNEIISKAQPT